MFCGIGADSVDGTTIFARTEEFGVAWAFHLRLFLLRTGCCTS